MDSFQFEVIKTQNDKVIELLSLIVAKYYPEEKKEATKK